VPFLRNLLSYIGINPERLRLDWVSSSEAPKFVKVTTEFVEVVRELGPLAETPKTLIPLEQQGA
jgi:F420-non-reducing hydrogenase iron-sulfur subunit